MAIETLVIPKPAYNVLRRLTGESRPEVALSIALKDLVRLRLEAARTRIAEFEQRYGMTYASFEEAWKAGKIPEAHSYAVEKDDWEWEAAVTDVVALEELSQLLI
jgi:hypothetical protein